jgi:cobyrinic acid a,c-diamide synthase
VQAAVEETCGIPVIGWLKRDEAIRIPERHLGLVPSVERGELGSLFDGLADRIAETFDLDRLLSLAEAPAITAKAKLFARRSAAPKVTVAVAKDAAFHFYYTENLELLEAYGAELVYFSPRAGEPVPPHADGLYIGGGFPEQFAAELAAGEAVKASVRGAIEAGLPTIAECGGFMYLTGEIEDSEGRRFPMAGVLPGRVKMQRKLAALGYRELTAMTGNPLLAPGEMAKGHEFHYSVYEQADETLAPAYLSKGLRGTKEEGMLYRNAIAGYTHVHFASNPEMVSRFLNHCLNVKEGKR